MQHLPQHQDGLLGLCGGGQEQGLEAFGIKSWPAQCGLRCAFDVHLGKLKGQSEVC